MVPFQVGGQGWILEVTFLKMKEWISCDSMVSKSADFCL